MILRFKGAFGSIDKSRPSINNALMTTAQLQSLDKQHLWHPFTPMSLWLDGDPLVITSAEGFHLIDSEGRRYLDGISSLWCNVHGHNVPEIDAAIRAQLEKVAHTTLLGLASEPSIMLADRLMRIIPQNLKKVFYSDAGATATEIAFKLAAQYWYNTGHPEKSEFIGFTEAYHGDTLGAMSIGRTELFHKPYFPLLFEVHFAPTPFTYRWAKKGTGTISSSPQNPSEVKQQALAALTNILEKHHPRIAAICIEPIVQGAAGMIIQPDGFLAEVRKLATEYNTLLICDEVATGFARTGKMFAVEHENVQPDLMCVAKGLTGGYLPLAATFATQKIFDAFLGQPSEGKTFFHGHTYTGNPLACAAAIANLDLMQQNQTVANVANNAPKLAALLEPLKHHPHVGEIRQKGHMVGIELVKDKPTKTRFNPAHRTAHTICHNLRNRGVILRPIGDTLILMPAPAMAFEHLKTIVNALHSELEHFSPQL
jgi:adenosylmethionine-8-amino-7-oxononanoate transaminase